MPSRCKYTRNPPQVGLHSISDGPDEFAFKMMFFAFKMMNSLLKLLNSVFEMLLLCVFRAIAVAISLLAGVWTLRVFIESGQEDGRALAAKRHLEKHQKKQKKK